MRAKALRDAPFAGDVFIWSVAILPKLVAFRNGRLVSVCAENGG
jgi:hypothetical protein